MDEEKKDPTYEVILDAAKDLFFKQGKIHATTQEIADAAGVNRTLINYYFRSRNAMIDIIFKEAFEEEEKQQETIVLSKLPLREKLENFMDLSFAYAKKYPFMRVFMITYMTQAEIYDFSVKDQIQEMLPVLFSEIEEEMNEGNLHKMEPIQFILNFISLVYMPIFMRPLLQQWMKLSEEEYDRIIASRKEVILNTIYKQKDL